MSDRDKLVAKRDELIRRFNAARKRALIASALKSGQCARMCADREYTDTTYLVAYAEEEADAEADCMMLKEELNACDSSALLTERMIENLELQRAMAQYKAGAK